MLGGDPKMMTVERNPAMLAEIAKTINEEVNRFRGQETFANAMRCAAQMVMEEVEGATASDFGDAAASLGMHRQGAMNRFNEAKKVMEQYA